MALTIAIKNDISEIPLSELLGSTTVSTPLSLDTSGTSTPTKYVRRTETQNVREKASHRKRSKIHVRNITIPVDIDFYGFNQSLDISSDSSDFQTEDSTQQVLSVRQMQEGNSVSYVDRSHYLLNINKLQRFQSMNSLFSEDYQLLASKRRFFSDIPRSKIPVRVKKLLPSVKKNHPIYEQIVPKIEYFPNSSEVSYTFFVNLITNHFNHSWNSLLFQLMYVNVF